MKNETLKLILLPGMDGTGRIYNQFLKCFNQKIDIIPLPQKVKQDYQTLAADIASKLPNEECVLIVESFSGGIIPLLLERSNAKIKGIIFVASFVSSPNKMLMSLAKVLPFDVMKKMPKIVFKHRWLLGKNASNAMVREFIEALCSVPSSILRSRIQSMTNMLHPQNFTSNLPCVYIRPSHDVLINASKSKEIADIFSSYTSLNVDGSHFILQSNPSDSAIAVNKALAILKAQKER